MVRESTGTHEMPVKEIDSAKNVWEPGDLAWAKVGRHHFWPCVIIVDPNLGQFTHTKKVGRSDQQQIHVQFFGDNGSYSWVSASWTLKFEGKENLLKFAKTVKKDKRYATAFPPSKESMKWSCAVKAAEEAVNKSRKERLEFFQECYPIDCSVKKTVESSETLKKEKSDAKKSQKRKTLGEKSKKEAKKKSKELDSSVDDDVPLKKIKDRLVSNVLAEKSGNKTTVKRRKYKRRKTPIRPGKFEVFFDQCAHIVVIGSPELKDNEEGLQKMMEAMWSTMTAEEQSKYNIRDYDE